jgi:hypothetical protein
MRHKHADVIIAWAEGKRIQYKSVDEVQWNDIHARNTPAWYDSFEYRVKPEEVVEYTAVDNKNIPGATFFSSFEGVDKYYNWSREYFPDTYLQRTTIDGKVVDFKLVHKEQ